MRKVSLHNLLWRITHRQSHYDDSPQGFDATKIWTPEYVELLQRGVNDRYRTTLVLGRADRFLLDCRSVLDVGCGWMPYTPDATRYTGTDISEAMLARARELHPDIHFIHASAYELPFSDNSFEGVRSAGMLRHMKDWTSALQEMLRITRYKITFSHLVGAQARQRGRYQWCVPITDVLGALPIGATVNTQVLKRWQSFQSVLFMVTLNGRGRNDDTR